MPAILKFNRDYILSAISLLFVIFSTPAKSQSTIADSAFVKLALTKTIAKYEDAIGAARGLYNGKEYVRNGIRAQGFPFFEKDSLMDGVLFYDGEMYSKIPMQFDLAEQNLIIQNFDRSSNIKLISEKIKYFNLYNHQFVYLSINSKFNLPEAGFYDQLSEGQLAAFVRRTKRLIFSNQTSENQASYKSENEYYLLKNDRFQKITNERSILNLLDDRQADIRNFIRLNRIHFKKDPERSLKLISEYYNKIVN